MATLLYEELGVQATATVEEIKKAYRKRALQTHPDRLPPTASQEQKKASEEKFRQVNHAYEILTDPGKRKEYDRHGVWPPPVDEIPPASSSNGGFGAHFDFGTDPFGGFSHRHHRSFPAFAFQDPFVLFNSIFADMLGPRSSFGGFQSGPAFSDDPFERLESLERELRHREMEMNSFTGFNANPMASPFIFMGGPGAGGFLGSSSSFGMLPEPPRRGSGGRGGGKWMSESYMTQSINGVTQTIHKRRDYEGNDHVTRTFPDGRQVYTINGVEQSEHSSLPSSSESRHITAPSQEPRRLPPVSSSTLPPPPPYSGYGGSQQGFYNTAPSASHAYRTNSLHTHGAPQSHTMPAYPQVTRKSDRLTEAALPHATTPALAATPATYPQGQGHRGHDGHSHRRRSRGTENLHQPEDDGHQNHLHGTHEKSRNPHHPNPSPYYLDDIDRDPYHHKHHHPRRWDTR